MNFFRLKISHLCNFNGKDVVLDNSSGSDFFFHFSNSIVTNVGRVISRAVKQLDQRVMTFNKKRSLHYNFGLVE